MLNNILELLLGPPEEKVEVTINKSDPWNDPFSPVDYDGARLITDEVEIYQKRHDV